MILYTPCQSYYNSVRYTQPIYSNGIVHVIAGNKLLFFSGKLFVNGGDIIDGGKTQNCWLKQDKDQNNFKLIPD